MALSPADFAAYSRATGAPYPESPEERAQMVPEVRQFRQSQLQQSNNQGSDTLALGIGLGLGLAGLGAGALKLRGRGKGQPKKDTAGKSSVKMADLSNQQASDLVETALLPEQTKAGVYERVKRKFPDIPGEQELTRAYAPEAQRAEAHAEKFGYADLNPAERKLTNLETGEIYSRGRSPDIPSDLLTQFSNELEELGLDKITRGEAGQMLAGPEVAAETRQMMGTESSRQSAAVRRMEKEEENLAKNILSELAQETLSQADSEKAARIARNRQQDVSRVAGMVFDAIDTEISEGYSVPENISKLANRASTGAIDEQDVNTFRNWMQGAYKDDPTVLREMNEELSLVFPQQQSTLVTSQENRLPIVQEQATDALASTDDNVVNRVRLDAQRNEDLDLATGVETPAAGDPFGKSAETAQDVDLIQESRQVSAKAFLENERDNIASELAEQGLPIRPSAVERELANRLGKEAYKYGPEYTQMKHSIELGVTYDPNLLENPGAQAVRVQDQKLPLSFFKEETRMPETVARQQERIQKQKDWSEGIREAEAFKAGKISGEIDAIGQQMSDYQELDQAVSDLPKSFKSRSEQQAAQRLKGDLEAAAVAQDQLQNRLENLQYELYKGEKRVAGAERATQENIQKIKDQGLPLKLKDPTGAGLQIRPKDSKLITNLEYEGGGAKAGVPVGPGSDIEYEMSFMRPPRTEESTKTRGSSMQYDQGDKGVIGVYGEQQSGFGQGTESQQAAAKPSLVDPEPQKYRGGYLTNPLQFESPDAQLKAKKGPSPQSFYIASREPVISTALEDSEIIRRKAIEGRNPQSSLAERAQQQSRPRIAALRQEAARRKATGDRLMTKTEAFNFLRNYPQ
jgi:hypothetical protein